MGFELLVDFTEKHEIYGHAYEFCIQNRKFWRKFCCLGKKVVDVRGIELFELNFFMLKLPRARKKIRDVIHQKVFGHRT